VYDYRTVMPIQVLSGPGKKGPGKKGPGKNGPVKTVRVLKTVLGKNGSGKKGPS